MEENKIKKYRSASIDVVANGFIVHIGCQTVVAETAKKLLEMISEYLNDPTVAEKKLFANSIILGGVAQEVVPSEGRRELDYTATEHAGSPLGNSLGHTLR